MSQLCTLSSCSRGNSVFLSHEDTNILIDAGISMRKAENSLRGIGYSLKDIHAILITHEHSDHIKGLQMITGKHGIDIYASEDTAAAILQKSPELCSKIHTFTPGTAFCIGSICITGFSTPHDSPGSVGYTIKCGEKTVSVVTDIGKITPEIENAVCCDMLLLEANHDKNMLMCGPYPYFLKRRILGPMGHLSNTDSANLACRAANSGAKQIILAHLSLENNTPDLALAEVSSALTAAGYTPGIDISISAAPAESPGRMYVF